jgi:hypothetical protein
MRKHIFGVALFIAVVGVSVFIYEYFGAPEVSDCGREMSARCVSTISTIQTFVIKPGELDGYDSKDAAVNLEYIEASMRSQTVKARVDLDWQGAGEPPKAIWLQIQFHNFDGSSAGWASEPVRISNPFDRGGKRLIETSLSCGSCANLPRNLYASASVWTRANADKKLVYEIGDMTPVLIQEQR